MRLQQIFKKKRTSSIHVMRGKCQCLRTCMAPSITSITSNVIPDQEIFQEHGRCYSRSRNIETGSWETTAWLGTGSLLAARCHGVMLLAGRDEETQTRARELGHRLALAIRAHAEKIMFISRGQRHPELLEHIRGHNEDLSLFNFHRAYAHDAASGGEAMSTTSALCEQYMNT